METQRCGTCGEVKPIEEFSFHNRLTGKRHTTCRACQRIHKRNFYLRNLESYKEKSARQHTESVERNRRLVHEYLAIHPCVDCRESDVDVLEFDHVEDGNRDRAISQLINSGVSWKRLLVEIAKCEVRCVNCHRVKTAKQFGWYKKLGP